MAGPTGFPALDSYSTAVVLLPPAHLQHPLNLFRAANDKSFPRWTSHITMLFPFVHASALATATEALQSAVSQCSIEPFDLSLDHVGQFTNKSYNTVFLAPSQSVEVQSLWKVLSKAAGYRGRPFAPHLTLGQARSPNELGLLKAAGESLLQHNDFTWPVGSVAILVKDDTDGGKMKIAHEIYLGDASSFAPSSVVSEQPLTHALMDDVWNIAGPLEPKIRESSSLNVMSFNILTDESHPPVDRFDRLKHDILSRSSDILCLQEVSNDLLHDLLHDDEIKARFQYCTHGPASTLPNIQNIIVLSSSQLPFTWQSVVLGDNKHKTASILTFTHASDRALVLSVVHLTAGHEPASVAKRQGEAQTLLSHLHTHYADKDWIVVGDTNVDSNGLPSSWSSIFADAWETLHPQDAGVTYDPAHNQLAAETVKRDKSAFRYDRMYIPRLGRLSLDAISVLRPESGQKSASDHWALFAELRIGNPIKDLTVPEQGREPQLNAQPQSSSTAAQNIPAPTRPISSPGIGTQGWRQEDYDLEKWLRENGGYPSPKQNDDRSSAIQSIRSILGGKDGGEAPSRHYQPLPPGVKLVFEPVGSRMLGTDTAESDLDVLCVGNLGQTTFFNLMRTRIQSYARACQAAHNVPALALRRFVKNAAVPMMRLVVNGVEVDLQYAPATKVAERWHEVYSLPSDDTLFNLPASTLRVLNAARDSQRLLALIPEDRLSSFRVAMRALKIWAVNRGISGAKFGYLGGMHLTLLLARIAVSAVNEGPAHMLEQFFGSYEHLNFEDQLLTLEGSAAAGSTYRRTAREPLVILSVERPIINIAAAATGPNVATIRSEIGRGYSMTHNFWPILQVCGTVEQGVRDFLGNYAAFVVVDLAFWGKDAMRMRALLGYVESKMIRLLLQLAKDGIHNPRLWPQAFIDGAHGSSETSDGTTNLKFLIGCSTTPALLAACSALADFEELVHNHDQYYDASEAYLGVSASSKEEVCDYALAPKSLAWADGGFDVDEDEEEDDVPTAAGTGAHAEHLTDEQDTASGDSHSAPAANQQVRGGKLRTSADVYNRLMWDTSVDSSDYIIGYEDRFIGIMEMPLRNWKREVEDEAFIPFHRVMHFRRVSDGIVVWDRRKRVDLVFGSGGAVV